MKNYDYEAAYRQAQSAYWGLAPNRMCLRVIELLPPDRPLKLLDIGCGEGRDAVFFARCGYDVTAFDLTSSGIEKLRRLADQANVYVNAFSADINDYRLDENYDILYSCGALHYIKPNLRGEIMENYKSYVNNNGIAAFQAFVTKPFIPPPPEREEAYLWKSGQLFLYFHDWYIEHCAEDVYHCNSSGIPHRHADNCVIARKYREN